MSAKEKNTSSSRLHFNVIDILIIVLVAACVTGIVLRFVVLDNLGKNIAEQNYYLSFTAKSLSHAELSALEKAYDEKDNGGNWVYLSDGTTELGQLSAIEVSDRESLVIKNADGSTVTAEYPESVSDEEAMWVVSGKILCSGNKSDDAGFLLNGKTYIGTNSELEIYTKYGDFTIRITEVKIGEEQ